MLLSFSLFLGTHLDDYVLVGCFADSQSLRIMFNKQSEDIMSASVSSAPCTYVCCVHLSTIDGLHVCTYLRQCVYECWGLGRMPGRRGERSKREMNFYNRIIDL